MSATVFHIPFINSLPNLFKLHSVLERSATDERSEARNRYGSSITVVTTLQEVLDDNSVDCVVVGTPNVTHYPFAKAILEAGKHVIIEKPLVPTSKEADELIAIAAAHSPPLIIATYQNRRFDSDFLTLKTILEKRTLGDLADFTSHYDRWRPHVKGGTWKEQGGLGHGIVYDLGSHLIDQALTLFGTPDRLFAHIYNSRKQGAPEFDDAFFTTFFYDHVEDSGIPLVVHLRGSPLSAIEPQMRFTVKGTKGSFVKYGIDSQEDQLKLEPPMSTEDPAFGVESESNQGTLTTVDDKGDFVVGRVITEKGRYLNWYENVGAALQAGDPSLLYVKPEQARLTIRIIELMYESSRARRVVQVKGA